MSDRRFPQRPMVGVGAIIFSRDLEQVLLVQRGTPPSQGLWSFPGGLIHVGEAARAACIREIQEEVGLIVELSDLAVVAERILLEKNSNRPEYHYLILDFWGVHAVTELKAGTDASAAHWVAINKLPQYHTTRGVPEAIQRALCLAKGEPTSLPLFDE